MHSLPNLDLVRVGRLIYGVTPWLPKLKKELGLRSALTIRCEIVFISKVNKGDTIGFDKMYYAKDNMKIATLPIGFADVGRLFQGNSDVIINKTMSKVLSVASDQTLVDVTNIPNIKIGEKVIINLKNDVNSINWENVIHAIEAGPMLLDRGENAINITSDGI